LRAESDPISREETSSLPIHNADIAAIFNKVADLLELKGANAFRVRAYRNAARTVEDQTQSMADMLAEGKDLSELSGIGEDLAGKIAEIVETGGLEQLAELEEEIPGGLTELLNIDQIGPKRAAALHDELGVESLDDLAAAAQKGKIRRLEGFGEKSERKILEALERYPGEEKRTELAQAEQIVGPLLEYLEKVDGVERVVAAGSYRRRKETVGDLDILATCADNSPVMKAFTDFEDVVEIVSQGETKSTVRLRGNVQVDLRVVSGQSYGAALHYFTGNKQHNIAIRRMGVEKGLKINEYGIFRAGDDEQKRIAGEKEMDVFAAVDLPWIEPELRGNHGEIEAAQKDELPRLITLEDIRGDLHAHTEETDGHATLEDMVEAARGLGYSFLAITEHSQSVTVARGLDRKRLEKQIEAIEKFNDSLSGFRVLTGIEVDILEDGSLDLPDEVLARLDLTVCSIHSKFGLSEEKQTARIIRAMDNPNFRILGHPTGRLIGERAPYKVDMEQLMKAAGERGCVLELNAHPDRLDLNGAHCRMAREYGVKIAISTDAHSPGGLRNMKYGIDQARRGWLSADDVINTRRTRDLLRLLAR